MLTEGQFLTPRYTIVRHLKKGGMGAVYQGFDNLLDAPVAIKENCLEDPVMRAAFEREAQLLANFRHPSLPRCIDFLVIDGVQFLVMEFIEGDDLASMMVNEREPLSNEAVADLAWQMIDVLEYIHGESVLHRDIKPANIKSKDGRAYLLDFGLAYGQSGEMDTIRVGEFNWKYHSKRYSPLEQSRCRRTTPASDLYSLAATLYYLLTNVQPVDAEERFESISRGGRDLLEDVRIYNPAADVCLSRAIMQALSLGADERPQSAAEMREMMFPEVTVEPEAVGVRRFLTARRLSAIMAVGVLACILFFVPRPSKSTQISDPPATDRQVISSTPVKPVAEPSPVEEAAQLAKEAQLARQSGNEEEAALKLERALPLDDNNPSLRALLGDMLWEAIVDNGEISERRSEVLAEADRILRLVRSPSSAQEYVARAWANFAKANLDRAQHYQARLDNAIADTNEVLTKYEPDSVVALTIHASATYMKAGAKIDEETARRVLKLYDRAISLAPMYAQLYAHQAGIYFALGCRVNAPSRGEYLELARQGFEKAVELEPRAVFNKNLGYVYLEMMNFEKAGDNFSAAIREDHAYYQAYAGLGEVFFRMGRWEDAITNYKEANRLNKSSDKLKERVFMKLGAAYQNLKQSDRAAESYLHALKLNPNNLAAKQDLERVSGGQSAGDR